MRRPSRVVVVAGKAMGTVHPAATDLRVDQLLDLGGRVAVITGAARGIGLQTARRLAQAGATVLLSDRDESVLAAAATLTAEGLRCAAEIADVTVSADNDRLARRAVELFGGLDIWVANAGIYPQHPAAGMSDADWRRVVAVNLDGAFFGARAAVERMAGSGVIVLLSSVAGYRVGHVGRAHYVAAKHGVRGLVRALAKEWGPAGIRVVGIAPGFVQTEGMDALLAARRESGEPAPAVADRGIPIGRGGVPDDIATTILFAVSPMAALVTGVTIPVDGGILTG